MRPARLLLGALLLLLPGCGGDPVKTKEASDGAEPRINLTIGFPPGVYTGKTAMTTATEVTTPRGPFTLDAEFSVCEEITVSPPDTEKRIMVRKTISRITTKTPRGTLDTASTGEAAAAAPVRSLRKLVGTCTTITYGEDGMLLALERDEAALAAAATDDAAFDPAVRQLKEQFTQSSEGEMLGVIQRLLPDHPVGVAAVWHADLRLDMPLLGTTAFAAQCELKELTGSPGKRTAHVVYTARLESGETEPITIGRTEAKVSHAAFRITGAFRIGVESGLVTSHENAVEGTAALTARLPEREEESLTQKVSVKTEYTLTPRS